jgi:hypothetical protein
MEGAILKVVGSFEMTIIDIHQSDQFVIIGQGS